MIHQHVGGAAVETDRAAVGVQHGQVGDAPEVQHGDRFAGAREHGAVKRWHERRALAARCHIAAAQISDDIDAAQFGEQRGVVQLDRVPVAVELAGAMTHGLAVGANRVHLLGRDAAGGQQFIDRLRARAHQRIGRQRSAMQFIGPRRVQRQQLGGERWLEWPMRMSKHLQPAAREVDQHCVDPIERGAGHQADVDLVHRAIVAAKEKARDCGPAVVVSEASLRV